MGSEEEHQAAAKVPREFAIVEAGDIPKRVDLRTKHAEPYQGIRTNADACLTADWNANEQIARRGQNAAAADVGLAKEVGTVSEISLDAEDASAHVGQAETPVDALRIDRVRNLLP